MCDRGSLAFRGAGASDAATVLSMGVLATTQAMPGPTKIKRNLGMLLLGVVLIGIDFAVASVTQVGEDFIENLGAITAIVLGFAGLACFAAGIVLLLWGLLRD